MICKIYSGFLLLFPLNQSKREKCVKSAWKRQSRTREHHHKTAGVWDSHDGLIQVFAKKNKFLVWHFAHACNLEGSGMRSERKSNFLEPLKSSRAKRCFCILEEVDQRFCFYSLVGGLEHGFYDFPYIGNNHPNWLSYFSEGLKPPTRFFGR